MTLPGADDGFALAKLARAAGCGIIFVTDNARHFEAVKASGHRYLLKPFRVERLLALVKELVAAVKETAYQRRLVPAANSRPLNLGLSGAA